MISENINILLADDDNDDCQFFKEALEELPLTTQLTTVHDGDQLMHLLKKKLTDFQMCFSLT
jgi:CheY-like chemotaxis protein